MPILSASLYKWVKLWTTVYLLLSNSKSIEDLKSKSACSSITFFLHCCASDEFQHCLRNCIGIAAFSYV